MRTIRIFGDYSSNRTLKKLRFAPLRKLDVHERSMLSLVHVYRVRVTGATTGHSCPWYTEQERGKRVGVRYAPGEGAIPPNGGDLACAQEELGLLREEVGLVRS